MVWKSDSSGLSAPSLPFTTCVLPEPAGPTNMMGFLAFSIMSMKKIRLEVSTVGTKTLAMFMVFESKSTVDVESHCLNFCCLESTAKS